MTKELLQYFSGEELASDVWMSKYQVKDNSGKPLEVTPDDMHWRLAEKFADQEWVNVTNIDSNNHDKHENLSKFGREYYKNISGKTGKQLSELFYYYFSRFKYIVPQGSIMSILGHPFKTGSLSNCFVIPSPADSYGGILRADEHLVQLMKRRGGVGMNLNTLRPSKTLVSNAAGSSTGAHSFMHRYSNSTREVAQDGRRGALMLLMHCLHPDIFNFVTIKKERTAVTGANISTMLTDKFMKAARANEDFHCRFPIEAYREVAYSDLTYNKLIEYKKGCYVMRIHAKELFDLIIEMAWENAEPGIAFIDRIIDFSPDGVYEMYRAIASNPCGEQWLQAYDSCRLLALNLFSVVTNPFTDKARIDYKKLYEISYMQQRLADTLVDLEIEHVNAIIKKIESDPEPAEVKRVELELWQNILKTAKAGRRTGCGVTALADMLAALGIKYGSKESIKVIEKVFKTKMEAELDCTIDLAIMRGPFEGWNAEAEFHVNDNSELHGMNAFYQMLYDQFSTQVDRMMAYGRRNVSWSTVAPTGTVSIMTQTTSGLEPLFLPFYMRRKKINAADTESRVDFIDQNGDAWQEFAVLHPKFKEWLILFGKFYDVGMDDKYLKECFELSPWFGSCANDINWEERVEMQSLIQKYTTNAISSTINLPNNVSKEEVAKIYWRAWELGLKGVTVYRDGCRTGVLVNLESNTKEVAFSQKDATKRPKTLDCDVQAVKVKGVTYSIIVSTLEAHPYEVFVIPETLIRISKGKVVKERKGFYNLYNESGDVIYGNIGDVVTEEEAAIARLVSTSLRHGVNVKYLVDQLNKTEGNMVGFSKAIARVLKHYVPDGTVTKEECSECHQHTVIYSEGCKRCTSCGASKCG